MTYRIELHETQNRACDKCGAEDRKARTEDYICTQIQSVDDGLPVRCVGEWAYEKIYRLVNYFGIFVNGMKNQWANGLNYIEICSGPGRCVLKNMQSEIDGTALAIVTHPSFSLLQTATFIDFDESVVNTLNQRIANRNQQNKAKAIRGNFEDLEGLTQILRTIPRGLNLVSVDPTECDVPFETIKCIKDTLQNVDFIINVADGTDAGRNLANAILNDGFATVKAKYERFLGNADFFKLDETLKWAGAGNSLELRKAFRECYKRSLSGIGLNFTDEKRVLHYYSLVFATAHKRGLDFWKKANKIEPDNQRMLFD